MTPGANSDRALETRIATLCREALTANAIDCQPIAAGLGARRFFRVLLDGAPGSLIARCEAPEDPALRPAGVAPAPPLEPVRAFLEASGLPVPRRHAADHDAGIELLEDLGDTTLETLAHRVDSERRRTLYAQACDLVPRLQALAGDPGRVPSFARRLDASLFAYKAAQVCEWLVPCATGKPATAAEREAVSDAFGEIESSARAAPQRLAPRDFKAQNLHVVADSSGGDRLVMVDLQGAFLAPPEYDLVCLLRDLHVELEADEVRDQLDRVRPALPDAPSADEFDRRFALLTLSRVGKDVSRFLYAVHARGDARYRAFLPTGIRHLRSAASRAAALDPALSRFAELVAHLPEQPCAQ